MTDSLLRHLAVSGICMPGCPACEAGEPLGRGRAAETEVARLTIELQEMRGQVSDELYERLEAEKERDALRAHINAMCGWAETLAAVCGWTRQNAASYWASYDAARRSVSAGEPRA